MTVKIFPPAVIVALRPAPPLFELAEKLIVWLPEPEAPPVTVSHDALLVAVDVHPRGRLHRKAAGASRSRDTG